MPGYIDNSSDDALYSSYAQGRALAGTSIPEASQYAQWSAVLDAATCDFCGWADERVFDINIEPWDPPMHHGCRCLVAYIRKDEFTPNPDWGDGPPPSAFPPGRAKGQMGDRNIGKEPKPTTNKDRFLGAEEVGFKRKATNKEWAEMQEVADALFFGADTYSGLGGTTRKFRADELIASQDTVKTSTVDDLAKKIRSGEQLPNSDSVGEGVLVLKMGDRLYMTDGHHRMAAAFRTDTDLEAWLIDVTDF